MILFIIINIIVILTLSVVAYQTQRKKHPKKTYKDFIVGKKLSPKKLLIGLSFGIIFGFLDNVGLIIGIEKLTKKLNLDEIGQSAIGNTYSDFIGATVGTFISLILKHTFDVEEDPDEPFWLDTMGIVIGCLLGYYIPKMFMKK